MDQIENIGPLLGILSFVGLAVLVFMLVQQAREVRRLREWAGRAPERAILIAEREAAEKEETESGPGRVAAARAWLAGAYASVDRVSPVDPRFGIAFLAALAVAVVVLVGVVGVFDGGDDTATTAGSQADQADRRSVRVSVLNGTATPTSPAVPELASKVASKVERRGYRLGVVENGDSVPKSIAMYRRGKQEEGEQVAADVEKFLGSVDAVPMTDSVVAQSRGADVALIIGVDDSRL